MSDPGTLSGLRAVVTGAAGGIGAAVTAALRSDGALVDAWDILARNDLRTVDVTDRAAVIDAWHAASSSGPIDIVVSAAGVMSDDWDTCMAVNADGVRNLLDVAIDDLTGRKNGAVVVISSNAGATPRSGLAAYAASKAAATSYTRSLGLRAAPEGVRVNIVSPGSTDTPMLRGMWSDDTAHDRVLAGEPEAFRLGIPLGRIATPEDIAAAVVFLASDAARHITMHDLRVDGGATLDM
ncbi:SDR family oxidoreductase [Gordonia otitidis]|uniref:SDR family oxidoreductase n=1 Tax=Gordonia otitidis TaxID=249058 RepID=UPI001D13378C|nr:SDR family oxidoreductase [Gordonia otitidis]UEA59102.1 SDR family oxidoreductase [Gordonia otitidis]